MPIFDSNRELLDRFRRGERAALAAVYEHHVDEFHPRDPAHAFPRALTNLDSGVMVYARAAM